jgi:hypothetical protein
MFCRLFAFSGTLKIDGEEVTESQFNGLSEKALPAAFAYTKADDPHAVSRDQREFRILVVADKYQTGFDQPLLTTMYGSRAAQRCPARPQARLRSRSCGPCRAPAASPGVSARRRCVRVSC